MRAWEPGEAEGSTTRRLGPRAPTSKEAGDDIRPWLMAASYREVTKAYWMQWESLELKDRVLYHLWETPAGDES